MPGEVQLKDFEFERYRNASQLADGFSCSEPELNDFILNDDEVGYFERENLGRTYLVRHIMSWEIAAYYTLAPYSLRAQYSRRMSGYRPDHRVEELPCMMIGRFAVQQHWERKGLGSLLLSKIAYDAATSDHLPFRLLILTAKQRSIAFYERYGFVFSSKHGNEKRDCPVMIYDLAAFREAIGEETPAYQRASDPAQFSSLH